MNDYDDSEDYSSANSFRARSNTWPLNRPDLAVPNCVCIDETLPEIELEDDDLFTTNENWSTGLVDHDIMSWDPILNAQNQHQLQGATAANPQHQQQLQHQIQQQHNLQQQHSLPQHQQQAQQSQPATIHHHHHQHPPQQVAPQPHQRQQPHLQRQQQAPPPPQLPPPHHHHHQQQQQQQLPPPPHPPLSTQQQPHQQSHETLLSESSILLEGQVQPTHQQPQQLPPQHHQTLSNTRCLEADDPNEYHIQQLHHLRIGNGTQPPAADHQAHYISSLSTMCLPGSASAIGNDSYNISSDHQQHHLQPLTSARYDLDQQNELTLKTLDNDHHPHHHQLHHLTSSSLDHHSVSSHMLSSSLSTSGIGLSGDLEDLDYKLDPSTILQNPLFDDHQQTTEQQQQQQQQQQTGDNGGGNVINKQSNSSTSKTKLTTPRRNAWGNMSYADLISQAINSTNDKRLTLSQIYDWMVQHVPYFKDKGDSNSSAGWKNSVRHNLSLHNRFKRLQNEGTGKSSWWTINPEANVGKCARRRAASMEASKYEKKRGRAKKRAEAIRQGLVSFPSLTTNSLNGSTSALDQQPPQRHSSIALDQPQHHSSALEQQLHPSAIEQQQQQLHTAALESSALEQQQIQHHHHQSSTQFDLQQQQANGYICDNLHNRQPDTGLYVASSQNLQYEQKDIEWSYSEALRT